MPDPIKYTCANCGQEHEEWPALSYLAPLFYDQLSEEEKKNAAELSDDFCVVRDGDQIHRYIRATLTQKVIDHCEDLEYGLWVSLSEKSFEDYKANFHNENHEAGYFGWLANNLPGYQFESIPTNVIIRTGGLRPNIIPHNDVDNPFVRDYFNGITKEEAERRIDAALKNVIPDK
jgi:hypothetical protein